MSGLALSTRDRRALVLGVALLAPVLVWRLIVSPYTAAENRLQAELEIETDLLSRELAVVEEARGDAEAIARLAEVLGRQVPRLLGGDPGTRELAEYVQGIAGETPIHFEAVEPRALDGAERFLTPVCVEVRAESDLEGFLTLIRYLETGPKLVLLDSLSVFRSGSQSPEEPERLSFRFLATGLNVPASDTATITPITDSVLGS